MTGIKTVKIRLGVISRIIVSIALSITGFIVWSKTLRFLQDIKLFDFRNPDLGLGILVIGPYIFYTMILISALAYYFVLQKYQDYFLRQISFLTAMFLLSFLLLIFLHIAFTSTVPKFSKPIPSKYWFGVPEKLSECIEGGGGITSNIENTAFYCEHPRGIKLFEHPLSPDDAAYLKSKGYLVTP